MAELIYTLLPGQGSWDFDGVNDYLDGCAIYNSCYGVSGACGTGELGGFQNNVGTKHLSFGTFGSTFYVVNRSAQWLMNTTSMEYMIIDVIVGDDYNGGERPNNNGESLYLKCSSGGSTAPTLVAYSGRDGGYTFPDVQGGGNWFTVTVQIPAANRGLFLWEFYAYSVAQPEFAGSGGVYEQNVNAGDRYAISRIRIYGEVPTHIQYFRANDDFPTHSIIPGDPITFTWSTQLGNFQGATSGQIYLVNGGTETQIYSIPSGSLLSGSYTLNPGPSAETTYRLKVNGNSGILTRDITIKMLVPDNDPDPVTFSSITEAELGQVYSSNVVTISGLEVAVPVSVTNGAQMSINGGGFTTTAGTIGNGQSLQLRMQSSALFATLKTASVTIGSYTTTFKITTKSEPAQIPNTFTFNDVIDAPLQSYVQSNEVTITGITTDAIVTAPSAVLFGFESRVNDGTGWGPWNADPKTIANGQKLQLRVLTSDILGDTKTTTITVGAGAPASWSVTNQTVSDSVPDYFEFTDAVDQPPSTPIDSNTLTITGINVPTLVSTSNGATISVDGGPYNPSPVTITNNQTISVRLTSSPDPAGQVETTVTIGNSVNASLSDTWRITTTTSGDIIPDPFYFIDKDDQVPNTYVESNTIIIQGITSPSPFNVTNGQASVNGGAWAFTGNVSNGDTVKLRMISPAVVSTDKTVSITIG